MTRRVRTPRTASSKTALFESLEQRRYLSVTAANVPFDAPAVPAQEAAAPSADAQSQAKPLKVYSWHDWGIEGVTPTVWVRMHAGSPAQMAAETIPTLLEREPGDRALLMWNLGNEFMDRSLDKVIESGLNSNPNQQWLTTYFGLLKDAGITPDYIVMDYEGGMNYWNVPTADIERVMSDPSLRRQLPASLQEFEAGDFRHTSPRWRDAVTTWNAWANQDVVDALRDAVRDPAREVFGQEIPMSNWFDSLPSETVYDINGWGQTAEQGTSVSGASSPAFYLGGHGQLYQQYADPKWANFAGNINTLRSVVGSGSRVAPWVGDARDGGDPKLWAEQLRQIRASGVDTMLLWNYEQAQLSDEQFAVVQQQTRDGFAEVLAMPDTPDAVARQLPQVKLNAVTVETLGYGIDRLTRQTRLPVAAGHAEGGRDQEGAVTVLKLPTANPAAKPVPVATPIPVAQPVAQPAPAAEAEAAEAEQGGEIVYRPARNDVRVSFSPTPADPDDVDLRHTLASLLEQLRFRVQSLRDAAANDDETAAHDVLA